MKAIHGGAVENLRSVTSSIEMDYELPDTPAQVWQALTDPRLLEAWLMPNDIRPVVGHQFTFRTAPMHGWDGVVYCEVLEVVPQKLLAYRWQGPDLDTVVTWTLRPTVKAGTHLHLAHTGFQDRGFAYNAISGGWRKMASGISKAIAATI